LFDDGHNAAMSTYSTRNGQTYTAQATINGHYNRNPGCVLGRMQWESGPHGPVAVPVFGQDIAALAVELEQLIGNLPKDVYQPGVAEQAMSAQDPMTRYVNTDGAMPGHSSSRMAGSASPRVMSCWTWTACTAGLRESVCSG
jgi:hypothetical protein